jgi:hypothetical protein
MTPVEIHRSSDLATATLQAMRDAADAVDGRAVSTYVDLEPERYRAIFAESLADLAAPEVRPPMVGSMRLGPIAR